MRAHAVSARRPAQPRSEAGSTGRRGARRRPAARRRLPGHRGTPDPRPGSRSSAPIAAGAASRRRRARSDRARTAAPRGWTHPPPSAPGAARSSAPRARSGGSRPSSSRARHGPSSAAGGDEPARPVEPALDPESMAGRGSWVSRRASRAGGRRMAGPGPAVELVAHVRIDRYPVDRRPGHGDGRRAPGRSGHPPAMPSPCLRGRPPRPPRPSGRDARRPSSRKRSASGSSSRWLRRRTASNIQAEADRPGVPEHAPDVGISSPRAWRASSSTPVTA